MMGGKAAPRIRAAADALGAPIRRIALTHGHGDHIGAVDALKDQLGAAVEVLMSEPDARIHAGEHVVDGKLPGSWPKLATRPDTLLREGDRVGGLEVIAAPGHTPGHVAFLDPRDRTLIAGDVFTTYGRPQVTDHFYWRFPFAAMATWDKAADRASAEKLRALNAARVAVGHGPVVTSLA
jgi:glyoxylase-like metal-dependent hydrolase (beta-lactamase superfamily II)